MSGTAASMGDYGHSDVIKEECESALSLSAFTVCACLYNTRILLIHGRLAQVDQCISVCMNIHVVSCVFSTLCVEQNLSTWLHLAPMGCAPDEMSLSPDSMVRYDNGSLRPWSDHADQGNGFASVPVLSVLTLLFSILSVTTHSVLPAPSAEYVGCLSVETALLVSFPYTSSVKEEHRKPMTHAVCLQFCHHFLLAKFHVLKKGHECMCAPFVYDVPRRGVISPVRVMTRRLVEVSTRRR